MFRLYSNMVEPPDHTVVPAGIDEIQREIKDSARIPSEIYRRRVSDPGGQSMTQETTNATLRNVRFICKIQVVMLLLV
jgi:hypothetical protein